MSQINFFFSPEDILSILNKLFQSNEIEIFQGGFFKKQIPDHVQSIDDIKEFEELTFWLKNDKRQPVCHPVDRGINEGLFVFDYYRDPIIEFSDCSRKSATISPGRIFYKAGWIVDEDLRKEHEKWAKRVSRVFDKKAKKIDRFWRISDSVINWVNNNGSLELGRGGLLLNKENLSSHLDRP